MSDGQREALQWFGLLAGPLAWTVQLVLGFGVSDAACSSGVAPLGFSRVATVTALTVAAAIVAVLGELSALAVYRALRSVDGDAPGPDGRRRFLATGAMVGNVLLFVAIILGGVATAAHTGCGSA
jgi:hypothetical protein